MAIQKLHSYLVRPGKNTDNPPPISGSEIPNEGSLFSMLTEVYEKSAFECKIPIRFVKSDDGEQKNEVLSLLASYTLDPSQENGLRIAERLRDYTTNRSKLGLLFILQGTEDEQYRLVLSRFPADKGILAEIKGEQLEVEFLERIFMKNANSYKAALYEGTLPEEHFWSGHAIDKQLESTAQYWIQEFLKSDFLTTSKAGSERIAKAIRDATKKTDDVFTQREIVSAGMLIPGYGGRTITLSQLLDNFGLSSKAKDIIIDQLPYEELAYSTFILDADEYRMHAKFASIELDNGGILMAPPDKFNTCFQREVVDQNMNTYRFTTEGKIINERVKGR